jgi:putative FmdB family regulatory protein
MPIYEYVCDSCGNSFERIQPFSADPVETCPQCSSPVRRVISPVGVIFKGSGWYITDSKRQLSAGPGPATSKQIGDGGGKEKAADSPAPSSAPPAKEKAAKSADS